MPPITASMGYQTFTTSTKCLSRPTKRARGTDEGAHARAAKGDASLPPLTRLSSSPLWPNHLINDGTLSEEEDAAAADDNNHASSSQWRWSTKIFISGYTVSMSRIQGLSATLVSGHLAGSKNKHFYSLLDGH